MHLEAVHITFRTPPSLLTHLAAGCLGHDGTVALLLRWAAGLEPPRRLLGADPPPGKMVPPCNFAVAATPPRRSSCHAYTLRRPHTCHGPRAAHSLSHPSCHQSRINLERWAHNLFGYETQTTPSNLGVLGDVKHFQLSFQSPPMDTSSGPLAF